MNIGDYVIVRAYAAGVFAGTIKSQSGDVVTLTNARRIWYWDGAASLSQLAMEGTSKPGNCKFPAPVNAVEIHGVIEILETTPNSRKSIKEVPAWTA